MEVAEVDEHYRITIPKELRSTFKVTKGQRFFIVRYGDGLLLKPLPTDPAAKLDQIIGDFKFGRESRRKAEAWLLKEKNRRSPRFVRRGPQTRVRRLHCAANPM